MIYDKIKNIALYKGLSDDIYAGLKYLKDLSPDIAPGTYEINPRVKAFVSEYTTKSENENGYEAHRQFIDIQYLISGKERIKCLPLEYLKETKAYSAENDAAFYEENGVKPSDLLLGNGYFSIFFPQDAHMPQLCINAPEEVKKVIIKVKI
jgi:YhcH/YjgK/YiaL family protein